ncbi:hypothetical protein Rsub_12522 [Raphidocelis subcapitata]|uniref:BZIP domain-containing protein n=1 Tax=Raphidocelis subcapitata TaxID=307507 RepID=A0A2V0PQG4_9CHLO|nr:hypothetical protein Rsub_12522 [Raphidocelis subcapitata]|eukprot:GBF99747.1 hypothetical protein Rsub_12522 [Raphidocelis subcapitata]
MDAAAADAERRLERRRASNRQAQRKYLARKKQSLAGLHALLQACTAEVEALLHDNAVLRARERVLQRAIQGNSAQLSVLSRQLAGPWSNSSSVEATPEPQAQPTPWAEPAGSKAGSAAPQLSAEDGSGPSSQTAAPCAPAAAGPCASGGIEAQLEGAQPAPPLESGLQSALRQLHSAGRLGLRGSVPLHIFQLIGERLGAAVVAFQAADALPPGPDAGAALAAATGLYRSLRGFVREANMTCLQLRSRSAAQTYRP